MARYTQHDPLFKTMQTHQTYNIDDWGYQVCHLAHYENSREKKVSGQTRPENRQGSKSVFGQTYIKYDKDPFQNVKNFLLKKI
jgi:arginyl-tRNA synthetase